MDMRVSRSRPPSRSGATPRTGMLAKAAVSKAAAARLARVSGTDMPWLGRGGYAMLGGYDGPEVSGPAEYRPGSTKHR